LQNKLSLRQEVKNFVDLIQPHIVKVLHMSSLANIEENDYESTTELMQLSDIVTPAKSAAPSVVDFVIAIGTHGRESKNVRKHTDHKLGLQLLHFFSMLRTSNERIELQYGLLYGLVLMSYRVPRGFLDMNATMDNCIGFEPLQAWLDERAAAEQRLLQQF
jgi:hypothetical protein